MSEIFKLILVVWLGCACVFGFVLFIGMAVWRLYTGKRTYFGEVFSHWDFKDGLFLSLFLPFLAIRKLWRVITRSKSNKEIQSLSLPKPLTSSSKVGQQKSASASLPICPVCGKLMCRRSSKYGSFWGCSTYPKCKGTRSI